MMSPSNPMRRQINLVNLSGQIQHCITDCIGVAQIKQAVNFNIIVSVKRILDWLAGRNIAHLTAKIIIWCRCCAADRGKAVIIKIIIEGADFRQLRPSGQQAVSIMSKSVKRRLRETPPSQSGNVNLYYLAFDICQLSNI